MSQDYTESCGWAADRFTTPAEYLIRHKKFEWWTKYNFLLSAGLDAGAVFSGILIFFTLQLPKSGKICESPRRLDGDHAA